MNLARNWIKVVWQLTGSSAARLCNNIINFTEGEESCVLGFPLNFKVFRNSTPNLNADLSTATALFTPLVISIYALTPRANLHHLLIYAILIFGLAPFGSFICIYFNIFSISFLIYAFF
jgi:hypothetical protein